MHLLPCVYFFLLFKEIVNRIHWELFPNNRVLTQELLHEIRDIIVHAAGGLHETVFDSV